MTIGQRIRERRKELNLSADDLAEKLGKDRSTIYRYENGDIGNFPTDVLEPLAKILQTTPADLMGWAYNPEFKSKLSYEAERLLREFDSCADSEIKENVIDILRRLNQIFNESREISAIIDLLPADVYRRESDLIDLSNYLKGMYAYASQASELILKIPNRIHESVVQNTHEFQKQHEPKKQAKVIPLRISEQSASAGDGMYLGPESFRVISVLYNDMTDHAGFAVPVSGDSMEPKYHDGDVLLIVKETVAVGEIGLFTLDGCGYVKKLGNGKLISINPKYNPIPLNDSAICNGKVIGVLPKEWIVEK